MAGTSFPTVFPTVRLTLAQMRRSAGRLAAAGVAIVIGTAFVAVTLLAGKVITGTTYDMIAAEYGDADVVVATEGRFTPDVAQRLAQVDGVGAAQPLTIYFGKIMNAGKGGYLPVVPRPADERLTPLTLTDGAWPAASGELALDAAQAGRMDVGVGDLVVLHRWAATGEGTADESEEGSEDSGGEYAEIVEKLRVTGLVDDPYGAYTASGGAAVATTADVTAWTQADGSGEVSEVLLALDEPLGSDAVPAALAGELMDVATASIDPESGVATVAVQSASERAEQRTADRMGGEDLAFLVFVLTFAAIALFVAGLVITNTFQVLVAQRTRTLALLRCIGSGRGQIYRSVLLEAGLLGVIGSLAGIVTGIGLGQAALSVAPVFDLGVPLPATVTVTPEVFLLPLGVGLLVTLVAALSPALAATRVAPLAALRPSDAPTVRARSGRARAVLATLLTVTGVALLVGGTVIGMQSRPDVGLLVSVSGGGVSFIGIIVGSVLWLPRFTAGVGRLVGGAGATARLAAANTLRNPRRTAATSTALLIGVTLVTMMTTGAESARRSAETMIDESFPVDLMVQTQDTDAVAAAVEQVSGVTATAAAAAGDIEIAGGEFGVSAIDPAELGPVVNVPQEAESLEPGVILLTEDAAESLDAAAGSTLTASGPGGSVDLTVAITSSSGLNRTLALTDLQTLLPDLAVTQVWAGLADGADAQSVLATVQERAGAVDSTATVYGAAVQNAQFRQVVDTILAIVVGLLAVAVVIALIGVANTLSLSVIERTRESATLRAIGLSKGQLRGMLAVEGMLIAGVGAVIGIVLGTAYGWAGAVTALSLMGDVDLAVPWSDITAVVVVAVVAGLVASVAPARAAVRTSPVAALAAD